MTINRHNYEEFFILYMDNELSSEERRKVELFVEQHPDLREELEMLEQTKFTPDSQVVFENKQGLTKLVSNDFITAGNYIEWLTLYIDNELNADQRNAVETFASNNPVVEKELALLAATKLQPDTIIFENKESLYRTEEKRRVVPMRWWRVAAAAILLLALTLGGVAIYRNGKTIQDGTGIAKSGDQIKKQNSNAVVINPPTPSINNPIANVDDKKDSKESPEIVKENNSVERKETKRIPVNEVKKENELLADYNNNPNNPNNLPDASRNPNMNGKVETVNTFIASNTPSKEALTNTDVTNNISWASDQKQIGEQPTEDEPELPGKKTKFRGILRKITRTIEKTTNIKTTDENDRLLVASLAIKL